MQVQHASIRKQERLLRKRPSAKDSQEQNNNGKEIFAAVSEPELNKMFAPKCAFNRDRKLQKQHRFIYISVCKTDQFGISQQYLQLQQPRLTTT